MTSAVLYTKKIINDKYYLFTPNNIVTSLNDNNIDDLYFNCDDIYYYNILEAHQKDLLNSDYFVVNYCFSSDINVKKELWKQYGNEELFGKYGVFDTYIKLIRTKKNLIESNPLDNFEYDNIIDYQGLQGGVLENIDSDTIILSYYSHLSHRFRVMRNILNRHKKNNNYDYSIFTLKIPLSRYKDLIDKYIELINFCCNDIPYFNRDINYGMLSKKSQKILIDLIKDNKDIVYAICDSKQLDKLEFSLDFYPETSDKLDKCKIIKLKDYK